MIPPDIPDAFLYDYSSDMSSGMGFDGIDADPAGSV